MKELQVFKKCPMCEHNWSTREDLLTDSDVEITGYMANFRNLELGIFIFNHLSCKGTFSVKALYFIDLYEKEIYSESKLGSDECPEYCLDHNSLDSCNMQCECAYVRDVIQIIRFWPRLEFSCDRE